MDLAFFDRTGRGRLILTGRDIRDLLHRLATNSILGMQPGECVATCFTSNKGRMIDWSVVLDRGENLLILSGNPERLSGHIQQYTITEDVTVRNYMAIEVVVCGPAAAGVIGVRPEPGRVVETDLAGVRVEVVRIEPLLGEAYSILAPDAVAIRRLLAEHGPVLDTAGVDALRVDAGIPACPQEINERHNPWEAGLVDAINLEKGCYVGQEVIARLHTYDKVTRRLARLELDRPREPGVVSDDLELTTIAGMKALGYVAAAAQPGDEVDGVRLVS